VQRTPTQAELQAFDQASKVTSFGRLISELVWISSRDLSEVEIITNSGVR